MLKTLRSHATTRNRVWAKLDAVEGFRFAGIDGGRMESRGVSIPLAEVGGQDALADWWLNVLAALQKAGALALCGGTLDAAEDEPTEDEGA